MPYTISKKGERYFVQNEMTKRVLGNHKTEKEAKEQMAALHANMPKMEKDNKKEHGY